jgi:hypothetical protein
LDHEPSVIKKERAQSGEFFAAAGSSRATV